MHARLLPAAVIAAAGVALVAAGAPVAQDTTARADTARSLTVAVAKLGGRRVTPKSGSWLGTSVALSKDGGTVLVGAPGMDGKRGAAWVFTGRGSSWSSFKLIPLRAVGKAQFGTSVALSEDGRVALVGAPYDRSETGAAWIYRRSGPGWIGQKLTPGDVSALARFGASVALSANGRNVLVGGPREGGRLTGGAAWWFMQAGTTWRQIGTKLRGAGEFGASMDMLPDASSFLIGAPSWKGGVAWHYTNRPWAGPTRPRDQVEAFGQKWFVKKLTAAGGRFGESVALGDRSALVGAPRTDGGKGAAWSFEVRLPGYGWPRQKLSGRGGGFGSSVALAFGVPVIGASATLGGKGAVWRVAGRYGGELWSVPVRVPLEGLVGKARAGASLAYAGGFMAVGAPGDDGRGAVLLLVDNPPVVTGVAPAAGPTEGGIEVVISGDDFSCAAVVGGGCAFVKVKRVLFGSQPATRVGGSSDTMIRVMAPPGTPGTVDVTVVGSRGTSATSPADLFTYLRRPAVDAVEPSAGPTTGGTQVTITGSDLVGTSAVRFGALPAASFVVESGKRIRAVTPPAPAGTVDVTVVTPGGTSAAGVGSRFTYAVPQSVIGFDDLVTGGPGQALVRVTSQYAASGVTFNSPSAVDYSKGPSAIPGFARSGTIAIEQCVGVEFCTAPIGATFAAAKSLVRVWVGFSFALNQSLQVQLRAYDAGGAIVGTASATLPARTTPTPISMPLEVQASSARITRIEVSVPGGFNNALAVDDVTFTP